MSIECWEYGGRRHLLLCLLVPCLILSISDAARLGRSAFLDSAPIRSEFIDPNNRTIWDMFNLTEAQVSRIRAGSNASGKDEATQPTNNQLHNHIRAQRINEIITQIQTAISNKSEDNRQQDRPMHELAGYPICSAEASAMTWQQSNNVTLQFASSIFERNNGNLHLESATLRLFKLNPKANGLPEPSEESADKTTTACAEPLLESQIRVTVSIVHQLKKKQRKKRICNTMMLSSTKTGWVEIDIKCAIQYWEQQQQQPQQPPIVVGVLFVEVHDDEDNQLKPGLYFQPPKCEQADLAVPWSIYRSKAPMPSTEDIHVPSYPRLDISFSGNGLFAPKNFEVDKSAIENFRRQYYNAPRNNDFESTTSNSPTVDNLLENVDNASQEREHIHQHRKRHYHSQTAESESADPEEANNSSSAQSESHSGHHRSRQHQHRHHHHHKHRHSRHQQE